MSKTDEDKAQKLMRTLEEGARSAKVALGQPLAYAVVGDSPVYEEPSMDSSRVGMVGEGGKVRGWPGSAAWVAVEPSCNGGREGWLPVREPGLDRRLILHAQWAELTLQKSFVDALEVSWLGIPDPPPPFKVTYSVEWRPRRATGKGQAAGHTLSPQAATTVRSLPPGSPVQLRVGVRVAPGSDVQSRQAGNAGIEVRLSGPWQDFYTDNAMKADYQDRSSLSSLMSLRASGALPKRFLRAVRGGMWGLEYRVNEMGDDGVFTPDAIPAGTPVEICPLLEIDTDCRKRSPVLKRLTVALPDRKNAFAAVLGFAQLYASTQEPNLHWGHLGPDEVLLWAAEDIDAKAELFVDFHKTAPKPTAEAAKLRPKSLHEPPQKLRSAPEKFFGAGFVVHGNSGLHGRGVFATRTTPPGQLIESCPVVQMDEGGAEALISYRWGAKNRGAGPFYIPMCHGCLYNHSERQNTHAQLDLGRNVLELVALEQLHVGQEILVNYGKDYFSEDYEGHRKGELLMVEEPSSQDLDMRIYIELIQALVRIFRDDAFQRQLDVFRQPLDPKALETPQARTKDLGKRSTLARGAIVKAQLPILERFGYSMDLEGSLAMSDFLRRMFTDPRTSDELREMSQEMVRLQDIAVAPAA